MSDHGHDSHDSEHSHGHGDEHGHRDSHEHGHGDGHGEHWGDYNAQPPAPSTLPPLTAVHLSILGLALAVLLAAIVGFSLRLSVASSHSAEAHGSAEHGGSEHKTEGGGEKKEHKEH